MEDYIHLQNLILFRKRLAEQNDESKRTVLLKLLADEEARAPLVTTSHSTATPAQGSEFESLISSAEMLSARGAAASRRGPSRTDAGRPG